MSEGETPFFDWTRADTCPEAKPAEGDGADFLERGRRKLLLEVESNRRELAAMDECDRMVSPLGAEFHTDGWVGNWTVPPRKSFTKKEREAVLAKFGGRCAYCGCPLTLKTLQVDHIHNVNMYGDNHDLSNLFPTCRQCNFIKSTNTVNQFRRHLMRMLSTMHRQSATFRMMERYGFIDHTRPPIAFWFEKYIEGEEVAQQRAFRRMGMW